MLSQTPRHRGRRGRPRPAQGRANVVLDPVMVATSGDRLLEPDAVEQLRRLLIPKALVLTPNLPEAAALLDTSIADGRGRDARPGPAPARARRQGGADQGRPRQRAESVDLLVDAERHRAAVAPSALPRATPTAPAARCRRRSPRDLAKGRASSTPCAGRRATSPQRSPPPTGCDGRIRVRATVRSIIFIVTGEHDAQRKFRSEP